MDEKRKVTQEELDNACILHNKYIEGEDGGKQAVFENCSFERLEKYQICLPWKIDCCV